MKKKALIKSGIGIVIILSLVTILFFGVYRPWQSRWGATDREVKRKMPGDDIIAHPTFVATRAVTIKATPEEIWPWIIQIGYKKAGFYSHDWLDNARIPSADRIIPEFQNLQPGDSIPLDKDSYALVKELNPPESMLLWYQEGTSSQFTWAWGLYEQDKFHTRLVTRLRWREESLLYRLITDLFEIVMMRKCLLGIKQRVEKSKTLVFEKGLTVLAAEPGDLKDVKPQ